MNKKEIEEFAVMKTDITYIKESMNSNNTEHHEIKEMIQDFINSADSKYASKLSEKLVYGMAGLILTAFALVIINLVI